MITEDEIMAMSPAKQTFAWRQVEVAKKVKALMVDELQRCNNNINECVAIYKIHEMVAKTDRNYTTREGVRRAVANVAPELQRYATAFPEYLPKLDGEEDHE